MDGLAVITMTNVLRNRFTAQLHVDATAITLDLGDSHRMVVMGGIESSVEPYAHCLGMPGREPTSRDHETAELHQI
jgi:hypothetical protein